MFSLVSERFVGDLYDLASFRFGFDIFVLAGKDLDQMGVIGECSSSGNGPTYSLTPFVGAARQGFGFRIFTRLRQSQTQTPHCLERLLLVRTEHLLTHLK